MPTTLDHRSVRLHGREVAYVTGGEGPTVLLIHGIGGDWRTWEPVLDGLARQHRVVAVDLPGHGGSGKGAGDYSLARSRAPCAISAARSGWRARPWSATL